VGEELGGAVVARLGGILLQCLRRTGEGRLFVAEPVPEDLLPPHSTPQSADRLIYEDREHPLRYFGAWPSEDGEWLFIYASDGTSGSEILYRKTSETKFRTLLPGFDADYGPVTVEDGWLYYVTNRDASNYALRCIDLNDPSKTQTVIPESPEHLLEGVGTAGGYLFAQYLEDAQNKVAQYDLDGKKVRDVELPAIGTVGGFGGEKEDTELYYVLTN